MTAPAAEQPLEGVPRVRPVRPTRPVRPVRPALVRPREVWLAGVSIALARHLGWPAAVVRAIFAGAAALGLLWAGLAIFLRGEFGILPVAAASPLLYAWFWALVPRETATPDAPLRREVPVALALLVAAGVLALLVPVSWLVTWTPLPVGAVEATAAAVAAIVWTLAVDVRDERRAASAPRVRAVAGGFLVAFGLALLAGGFADSRTLVAIVAVVPVLLGVATFVVPPLLARASVRSAERAALAREEQRSEIAAHLHDSVLQTLAIIQNRAGAGTEIARIARAQERELRDWLFAGTDPFAGDLATEMRTIARELELEHAVRIEVVTVGDVGGIESRALAAAAREALANAARHAGGDVTVYAEATPDAVEVFVRDRGPGFDPDAVPDGRLGIRESIVGRMARAGGTGVVASGSDGTEVQLRMPRARLAGATGAGTGTGRTSGTTTGTNGTGGAA